MAKEQHGNEWKKYAEALEAYIKELEQWYQQYGGVSTQDGENPPPKPKPPVGP